MTSRSPGIKPLQERHGLSIGLLGEGDDDVSRGIHSFGGNGLNSCIKASSVSIEDSNQIEVIRVCEFEQISSRGQACDRESRPAHQK